MHKFTDIQQEIINQISRCNTHLRIAVTWFTNHEIFNAIIARRKEQNIEIDLIVLNDRINNKWEGVPFQFLIDLGGRFYYSSNEKMVHHKFCIIDDHTVITGSYNWTYYAEKRNWENIIITTDQKTVVAYLEEFQKVINAHLKIVDVVKSAIRTTLTNDLEYIATDYLLQADIEKEKGNDLQVGKIYTQVLKLNTKQPEIIAKRNAILEKYNSNELEVSPFEIGIHFKNGYFPVIPSFEKLPFTGKQSATTIEDNQKDLRVTIQKNNGFIKTILEFNLNNIKLAKKAEPIIEYILTLERSGLLTVYVAEIGGNNRKNSKSMNIKTEMSLIKK